MWKQKEIKTKSLCDQVKEVFERNIGATTDEINGWFKRFYANEWRLDDIVKAVDIVLGFKDKPVTIVGDYDADGVTSTTILYLALKAAGFSDVRKRIPLRFSEGFGINPKIIDEIKEGLVLTCDNGVAQVDAINKAKAKGLTVVIIDHHEPARDTDGNITLPDADCIIDPNAIEGQADFNGYCGAGLSLKFARALGEKLGKPNLYQAFLGLAAIGTVADVMELRMENYVIVRQGLKKLVDSRFCTTGLSALVSACAGNVVTAKDIGFKIGPVINAASRMRDDGAMLAADLLAFNGDINTAIRKTEQLCGLNDVRKGKKREALAAAEKQIADECMFGDVPLVLYLPGVPEGVIGIVAGNLCEKYAVPAIVLTDSDEEGVLRGSARSCGNCDIKAELDKVNAENSDVFASKYGGHKGAAGLSIKKDQLETFRAIISNNLSSTFVNDEAGNDEYDIEISASELAEAITELAKYEPFGEGNAAPVFKVSGFTVVPSYGKFVSFLGDGTIAKICGQNETEAIGFDMKGRFEKDPKNLDLLGSLSVNRFGGKSRIQVEFTDFADKGVEEKETPLALKLRSMALAKA